MVVDTTRSEDTLILYALNPKTTNLDFVNRELDHFFKRKQQNDPTDRFNFCAFIENGPVYYEDFVFEPSYIINALDEMKKNNSFAIPNLAGGIMIAITFIIDVFKAVSGKCFRLIILTDRMTPPLINLEVLQVLVDQVIEFPFFMDFVRINTDDPKEDLKLMKFSKKNNGEVYFAKNEKDLRKIMDTLLGKKKIPKAGDSQPPISHENEPFYENLAQDAWVLSGVESTGKVCQICRSGSGELIKCPKCGSISHPECLAQWAKMSNIGLPHIFRCMSCYNLLRLPKDFVAEVQSGAYKKKMQLQAANQHELLLERERNMAPQLKQTADPLGGMISSSETDDNWKDADTEFILEKDEKLQILFCEKCGAMNMPEAVKCSKCGNRLKR